MHHLIAALLFAACAAPALAQTADARHRLLPSAVGLHLGSRHLQGNPNVPGALGWNNRNQGLYALWALPGTAQGAAGLARGGHYAAAGVIAQNSLFERSAYAAYVYQGPSLATPLGHWAAAISLGAISGYDKALGPYTGGAVPAGLRVRGRCTSAGCQELLTRPVIAPLVAPSVRWAAQARSPLALRLHYLPRSGTVGSAALHLSAELAF